MDWKYLPTISATRVSLRFLTERDVDSLYTIFSDPEVMRYWSSPPLTDREAATRLLINIHEGFQRREFFQWGIARRADDRIIGTVTLFYLELNSRRAEIGFALGRAHWGNGYMREALQALLGYAFNELNLHGVEADVDPRNVTSVRLLERLGFQKEGCLRERWLVNGEAQDSLIYGLLRREWNSAGAGYQVLPTEPLAQRSGVSNTAGSRAGMAVERILTKAVIAGSSLVRRNVRRPFRRLRLCWDSLLGFVRNYLI